jgi:hypothetical protein
MTDLCAGIKRKRDVLDSLVLTRAPGTALAPGFGPAVMAPTTILRWPTRDLFFEVPASQASAD